MDFLKVEPYNHCRGNTCPGFFISHMKISFYVKNKHHPVVKRITKTATDELFGAMNKVLGVGARVGLNEDAEDQYSSFISVNFNGPKENAVDLIFEIEKELGEKFEIPTTSILYRIGQ
jgi:hypothetical protein